MFRRATASLSLILSCSLFAVSQSAPAPVPPDSISTLKVSVNLVPLRVVVRDAKGHAVGGLSKADFQILDQGKLQVISQFSAEHVAASSSVMLPGSEMPHLGAAPGRYTAYLFDDLRVQPQDLILARNAAVRRLNSLSAKDERVAILTTSGQKGIDFTGDRAKLQNAIAHLVSSITPREECPAMSFYMADLIVNEGDQSALNVAAQNVMHCEFSSNSKASPTARQLAQAAAREKAEMGRVETERTLRTLRALVQGMSKAPGERTIVVISPGFLISNDRDQVQIMDLAVRGDVRVSALDPRGLVTGYDVTAAPVDLRTASKNTYEFMGMEMDRAALDELADATGGVFFRNNNDLDEGFRRVGAPPEYSYVLGFSPEHSKFDGRFHKLRVTVANRSGLTVQARKGYYMPKK